VPLPDNEWVEWEGETFHLPNRSSQRAVRLAKLIVALVAPHVTVHSHDTWTWDGDEALLERVIQGALDDEANRALSTVERAVVKEFR
jgi:hypothetical protein